jgi:hypothetical protein
MPVMAALTGHRPWPTTARPDITPARPRPEASQPAVPLLAGPACAGEDPELFFPGPSLADEAAAKAICQRCPIRVRCLQGALDRREQFGIWGGVNVESGGQDLRGVPAADRGLLPTNDDPWARPLPALTTGAIS